MFYVIKYYQLNKETGVYELKHMHCDTIKAACEYLQFMEKTSVLRFRFHEESRVTMNPETIFAIIAYAIGMVYICRRYR